VITATTSTPTADPTLSTGSALPGGALGKNEFLKLLIAQLQHQDPMNPMQGDQMAAQLAQFSSLEQLQQINATLADQKSSAGSVLGAIQAGAAINTIGHTVMAASDQVQIGGTNGSKTVTADIAAIGATATLKIYNSAGVEVGSRSLGEVQAGRQTFDLGDAASGLADGTYTYEIDVKDGAGNPVAVQTYTTGKVDGVSSGQNGIVLNIGGITVPYSNVIQVIK
jgi:flagellar basal-body rod modification protein FlgD